MRKFVVFCVVVLAASAWADAPYIVRESVTFSQSGTPTATIRYRLIGGRAIVTVDIQTNINRSATGPDSDWVSIGERNFRNVTGDVNLLISPSDTEDKVITWQVDELLPDFKARNKSCRAVVKAWAPDAPPDYLVIDLRRDSKRQTTDPRVRYYVSADALPEDGGVTNSLYKTDFMVMRLIKARGKTFRMGSPSDETNHQSNEVVHNVTFTNADFYAAVYPVTYGQALHFASRSGADLQLDGTSGTGNGHIYQTQSFSNQAVSGYDTNHIAICCKYRNAHESDWPSKGHTVTAKSLCGQMRTRTGVDFDLPTEAQWEFFARAGATGAAYDGTLSKIAWYEGNNTDGYNKKARPVGLLKPNAWGLYDVLGSMFECCLDNYQANLGGDPVCDPVGPATGSNGRTVRGGHYTYSSSYARLARRTANSDAYQQVNKYSGVRLVAPVGLKWTESADSRMMSIEYDLDVDAIVTVDVQTNRTGAATSVEADWVTIGEENFTDVFGDVNRKVSAGFGKKVFWRADDVWPNQNFVEGGIRMVVRKWDLSNPPNYLVIDLRTDENRGTTESRERYFVSAGALPKGGVTNRIYKYDYLVMRRIPAQGTKWCMGSPSGESGRVDDDETQHYVTFAQEDFYCAIYPITCGQLDLLGGPSLSSWRVGGWPAHFYDTSLIAYTPPPMRTWDAIRGNADSHNWPSDGHAVAQGSYLGMLSVLDDGRDFDIPTDAQWEFVCRAGRSGDFGNGVGSSADAAGWWDGNSEKKGHEVGLKPANDWGVYDMHGNLWELVLDWYGLMSAESVMDPYGPLTGSSRVYRGGNAAYAWKYGRSAARWGRSTSSCLDLYGAFRPITPISGKWPNGGRVLPEEK